MLLTVCLVIIVVGIALMAVNRYVPMDDTVKNILNVVVICYLIYWILKTFGLLAKFASF